MLYSSTLKSINSRIAFLSRAPGNYSYVVSENTKFIMISGCGAGGGGGANGAGATSGNRGCGSGGSGGAHLIDQILKVKPNTIYNVRIGLGGSPGVATINQDGGNGGKGGDTSFGNLITMPGGGAGKGHKYLTAPTVSQVSDVTQPLVYNFPKTLEYLDMHRWSWATGLDQSRLHLPSRLANERKGGTGGKNNGSVIAVKGGPAGYVTRKGQEIVTKLGGEVIASSINSGGGGGASWFSVGADGSTTVGINAGLPGAGGGGAGIAGNLAYNGGWGGPGFMMIQEFFDDDPFLLFSLMSNPGYL